MKHILFIAVLLLTGCSKSYMEIPVSAMTSDESRMKAYSVVGDTSTAKEAIIHKSWQTYFKEYEDAYEKSGMTLRYQELTLSDGSRALLPVINYRPPPVMVAPPAEPSQHPVWGTINNVVNRGIMWAGIGWIAHEFRGMQESAYDSAGTTFNGPANVKGSYNVAGGSNYVEMQGNQNTNTGPSNNQQSTGGGSNSGLEACLSSPPGGYRYDGVPMYSPEKSCSSHYNELSAAGF